MSKKQRIKTAALPVPSSQAEAEQLLDRIGNLQRDVARIEAAMNDQLAAIQRDAHEEASPLNQEIDLSFKALHAWAEANREQLCGRHSKTAKLATGELSWRTTPPAVRITGGQDVIIERLHGLGLGKYLRLKEEIDKTAILADPKDAARVKGITIVQREEFVAKPFESQIERVETINRNEEAA